MLDENRDIATAVKVEVTVQKRWSELFNASQLMRLRKDASARRRTRRQRDACCTFRAHAGSISYERSSELAYKSACERHYRITMLRRVVTHRHPVSAFPGTQTEGAVYSA